MVTAWITKPAPAPVKRIPMFILGVVIGVCSAVWAGWGHADAPAAPPVHTVTVSAPCTP